MLDHRIDAHTARVAVLGRSLGHTWSPVIHNSIFAAAKRNAVYIPVTVDECDLSAVCAVFRSCFDGFNVTIPYKERIIPLLDEVDDAVRACGAVNTVENRGGRLIGHITDGLGMIRAIEEGGIPTKHIRALILGGGGAARVAAYEFLVRGGSVTLAVRSVEKGRILAQELAKTQRDGSSRIFVCPLGGITGTYDLLVNCTPVGMYPHTADSPVGSKTVSSCGAVFDAVYNPRETKLLAMARSLGKPTVEGLGMLYYQAVEAQRFWFGGDVGVDGTQLDRIYLELLAQMESTGKRKGIER